jgi:hypothetical protein
LQSVQTKRRLHSVQTASFTPKTIAELGNRAVETVVRLGDRQIGVPNFPVVVSMAEVLSMNTICPLCKQEADTSERLFFKSVACKRCGRFTIQAELTLTDDQRYVLSAVCRRWTDDKFPVIRHNNITSLLLQAPRFTIPEKLDELLVLAGQKTERIGERSALNLRDDYPLLVVRDPGEADFLAQALDERGLVKKEVQHLRLTVQGWERIEQIRQSGHASSLAFVAMYFHESTNDLYNNAIAPAIRDCGYEPLRIDQHEHVNRIDDEIIGQIRRSRFMVADFTGQRHGVYFEAGFMIGLGRNVIWMCSKDEIEKGIHFDVRQYNFIAWESLEDAKARLGNRILSIEGEGPRPKIKNAGL